MRKDDFARWLRRYGDAWEKRDAKAAIRLFTEDAEYHWTPLIPPMRGRDGIEAAWSGAVADQRDIRFTFRVLATPRNLGIATWHTELVRSSTGRAFQLDGMLTAEFDDGRLCRIFREWWHSSEGA
jgi:ketosteroid isomerase-like protein